MSIVEELRRSLPTGPRGLIQIVRSTVAKPRFSICILATNWVQLRDCLESFECRGFDLEFCEVMILDNTNGNTADAFVGLNEFLQAAQGDYVILTHQDVALIDHGRVELENRLSELTRHDPHWGVCGNAGYTLADKPVLYLSHPVSDDHVCGGPFPAAVVSLDENFIIARKLANLALSRDLEGFHHYGADLCVVADILGWNAYVIAFKVRHHSSGTVDYVYDRSGMAITQKYARALRPRWVNLVTEKPFHIGGSRITIARARTMRFLRTGVQRVRYCVGKARLHLGKKKLEP